MQNPKKRHIFRLRTLLVLLVVCLIVIGIGALLKSQLHKPQQTASDATKGGNTAAKIQKPDSTAPATSSKTPTADNFILLKPTGTFISNHHPNLKGSPAPNQIQSVCTTSSGAMCTITFTKADITKSLPAQETDEGGSTYWTWSLNDIGLTVGTWHVVAKATYGNQVKTAADPLDLEVSP